ncbi:MAG TPA: hypothetical protein VNV15_05915 [Opitutaceae bacterium]|jgi:hypothetical protein|nr:hypothetical protein [Opitutaceae bacterium]
MLVVFAACRTVPPPPMVEGGVVRSGQMAYHGAKSLVAEFELRQDAEDFDLELYKGVGTPLFTVRVVRGEVWAGGAMAARSWHGKTGGWMPGALAGWVGLAEVFARLPATDVPGWKIEVKRSGAGELLQLVAVHESSGETFDFRF